MATMRQYDMRHHDTLNSRIGIMTYDCSPLVDGDKEDAAIWYFQSVWNFEQLGDWLLVDGNEDDASLRYYTLQHSDQLDQHYDIWLLTTHRQQWWGQGMYEDEDDAPWQAHMGAQPRRMQEHLGSDPDWQWQDQWCKRSRHHVRGQQMQQGNLLQSIYVLCLACDCIYYQTLAHPGVPRVQS